MKKRILAFILSQAMILGLLTGCGSSTENTQASDDIVVENNGTEKQTEIVWPEVVPYMTSMPTGAENAEIYVEPVEGLPEDFIKGMDVSSVLAEEASGVVYYNKNGEKQDLFQILADAGVNYIRVRVWNDPYDTKGNGYGGGNCDAKTAAIIGRRAAACGMKLLVDFHYSDFWADPSKQKAPKEWAHMTYEDKKQAIYDYTKESLELMLSAGADIGMVQIGNETNNGMAGETEWERITPLMGKASSAIRDVAGEAGKDIRIAVHFTNIEDNDKLKRLAQTLADAKLDYDVFGVSYYPYWHGTMENLTNTLVYINETYGKKTAVLETSYAYTLENGDGFDNSVSEKDLLKDYAATVQSQATCIRDIMAATAAAGEAALGVFYWEGAWVPVGSDKTANESIWEENGSGWASSFSAKYDPDDAGLYYGGCSWENQAMFDFTGKALPSLDVFKYVNYGTICEPRVDFVESTVVNLNVGEELVLPETLHVVYNDRSLSGPVEVAWNEEEYSNIDTSVMADYVINGFLDDGTPVKCHVKVAKVNYVQNPGFEEKNTAMWKVTYNGSSNPTDVQTKESDALTGVNSFHFWSREALDFSVEQTVTGLSEGTYTLNAGIQGGDVGSEAQIYLYAVAGDTTYRSEPVTLSGWGNWQTPEIKGLVLDGGTEVTIGIHVTAAARGWGTIDDFYLYKE